MERSRFSLRMILGLVIGLMGLLGVALALVSSTIYRQHAFESQRESLSSLIRIKSEDLLEKLGENSRDLGLALQSDASFRKVVNTKNKAEIVRLLDNQFHQYFVTTGVMRLQRIVVYDLGFKLVAASSEGLTRLAPKSIVCPRLLTRARLRTGTTRLKPLTELCIFDNQPIYAVMVPIGSLLPRGYVVVVADPSHKLIKTQKALGMPIRLRLPDGKIVHQSNNWPVYTHMKHMFLAESKLKTPGGQVVLSITVAQDLKPLNLALKRVRTAIILVAAIATLITVLLMIWILRKTTLKPINTLATQLRLLRRDRQYFGQEIAIGGSTEIAELAKNFNEMTTELRDLYDTLEQMAFIDPLTSLPNRNLFNKQLKTFTHNANPGTKQPFALLLIDLDRFKAVNDALGHHFGDLLLKEIGDRLRDTLRGSDTVTRLNKEVIGPGEDGAIARLGGDEFAVILPEIKNFESAIIVAKKVLKAMEEPLVVEDKTLHIGLSIGIAMYPEHGEDKNVLLRRADVAMYHAKKTRSGYAVYDSKQDSDNLRNLDLEQALGEAINNGDLSLYFQPKIDLKTQRVCGTEALVRWQHPELGFIPPDDFIPLAEQTGLIRPLTSWVLKEALANCAIWQRARHAAGVSVNLSAMNLLDHNIDGVIREILEQSEVSYGSLTLELTESAMMTDPDYALEVLPKLRKMGIQLSIDDFGTGYSSLSYMTRLPVNEIKIDKSFVLAMSDDQNSAAIVRSTISLTHNMNLIVVAEGVEDYSSYKELQKLGCDIAQGYFIARPMPLENYLDWLEQFDKGKKVSGLALPYSTTIIMKR